MDEIDIVVKEAARVRDIEISRAGTIEIRTGAVNTSIINHPVGYVMGELVPGNHRFIKGNAVDRASRGV